ncbi:hypothetical protein TGRUB_433850, partial [Toxoplasma gondii RUB]
KREKKKRAERKKRREERKKRDCRLKSGVVARGDTQQAAGRLCLSEASLHWKKGKKREKNETTREEKRKNQMKNTVEKKRQQDRLLFQEASCSLPFVGEKWRGDSREG